MVDAVKYAGVDFDQIHTLEETVQEKGVEFEGRHKKGDILNLFFEEFAEAPGSAYLCSGPSGGFHL